MMGLFRWKQRRQVQQQPQSKPPLQASMSEFSNHEQGGADFPTSHLSAEIAVEPTIDPSPPPERAHEHLAHGFAELSENQFKAASAAFEQALQFDPDSARAHYGLAVVAQRAGDPARAMEAARTAAHLDPTDVDVQCLLGELSLATGDLTQAEAAFGAAIHADSQKPLAHSGMAKALFRLGHLDKAIRHAQAGTDLAPGEAQTWAEYGHLLQQAGDFDGARHAYGAALDVDPNLAIARAGLSGILARQGHLEEAVQWAKAATESDPNSPDLLTGLGYVLIEQGSLDQATRSFETALRLNGKAAAAHVGLALVLEKRGYLQEALVRARIGADLAPEVIAIRAQFAHFLLASRSYAEAAEAFREVLTRQPTHAGAMDGLRMAEAELESAVE